MDFQTLPEGVVQWAAARTAARWEKKVAGHLVASGVPTYLPLLTRVTHYRTKTRTVLQPVFPGYVFFSEPEFNGNQCIPVGCRRKIAQILRPPNPLLLAQELQQIAALLRDHQLLQERVYGRPGDRVQILRGEFTGFDGTILRLKPNRRELVLQITFLGLAATITLGEDAIQKE